MNGTRLVRYFLIAALFAVSVSPQLFAGERVPPSQAVLGLYKLTDIEESSEKAYSEVFGAANISGFVNSVILVNGQVEPGSFATVKFAPPAARQSEVKACIDHALAAAGMMETQQLFGNPGGRNTQLNLQITGTITVNTGNTRVNPGDWTILEVANIQSLVCKVNTFIP